MSKWWKIKNEIDTENIEVSLIGDIGGFDVDTKEFIEEFKNACKGNKKKIHLSLNSCGGSVFDGWAIYSTLKAEAPRLTIEVIGLAASIASVIMLAGSTRIMNRGTYMVIHNPWGVCVGEAKDMRVYAERLEMLRKDILNLYKEVSGREEKELSDMMDSETWIDPQKAKDMLFATDINEEAAAASISLTAEAAKLYHNAPKGAIEKTELTVRDAETALKGAGFSATESKAILSKGFQRDAEASQRDAELDRKLKALCEDCRF